MDPMEQMIVYDMSEIWNANEHQTEILLFGRNQNSETVCLRVVDVPFTLYMGLNPKLDKNILTEISARVASELNFWIANEIKYCSRTNCAQHQQQTKKKIMTLNTGPCLLDLVEAQINGHSPVKHHAIVQKKSMVGYQPTTTPFLEISLSDPAYASHACTFLYTKIDEMRWTMEDWAEVYGVQSNAVQAFLYASDLLDLNSLTNKARGIAGMDWVEFYGKDSQQQQKISTCIHEYKTTFRELKRVPDEIVQTLKEPRRVVLSYDIETDGNNGLLSDSSKNAVLVIGAVFRLHDGTIKKYGLVWLREPHHGVDPIDGVEVVTYRSETEMLLGYADLVRKHEPDVVLGFNNFRFDETYLNDRARLLLGGEPYLKYACRDRLKNHVSQIVMVDRSTKGDGHREAYMHDTPGIWNLDICVLARQRLGLANNGLNDVAGAVLKKQKNDMHHTQIGPCHRGSDADRARLVGYCAVDCELPLEIVETTDWILALSKEASGVGLLPKHATTLGKQALLTRFTGNFAMPDGILIPKHRQKKKLPPGFWTPEDSDDEGDELFVPMFARIPFEVLPEHKAFSETKKPTKKAKQHASLGPENTLHAYLTKQKLAAATEPQEEEEPEWDLVDEMEKLTMDEFQLMECDDGDDDEEDFEHMEIEENPKSKPQPKKMVQQLLEPKKRKASDVSETPQKQQKSNKQIRKAKYPGAHVFDTVNGMHEDPTLVYDFNSLYPSIMRGHNLSLDTLVGTHEDAKRMGLQEEKDYFVSAAGYCFTTSQKWRGIFPRMAEYAVMNRKKVKSQLKEAKSKGETTKCKVLDAEQNTLKLIANSLYGATGGSTSNLTCIYAAYAVTSYGRRYIFAVRELLTGRTEKEPDGPNYDAKRVGILIKSLDDLNDVEVRIVAGDTDSVFVEFKHPSLGKVGPSLQLERCIEIGRVIQTKLNASGKFPPELNIEFEKMLCPFAVGAKKHYAGCMYEPEKGNKPKSIAKGLAHVRKEAIPILKTTYKTVLEMLMEKLAPKKEIAKMVRAEVMKFYGETLAMNQITISQKLSRAPHLYKNPDHIPHVLVAKRWQRESPVDAPRVGDRVEYVLVEAFDPMDGKPYKTVYKKARAPYVVVRDRLRIDYVFTLETKFKQPLKDLLGMIFTDTEIYNMFKPQQTASAMQRRAEQRRQNVNEFISKWYNASSTETQEEPKRTEDQVMEELFG
jgi:DNA polymerase elongation subunit (family B)